MSSESKGIQINIYDKVVACELNLFIGFQQIIRITLDHMDPVQRL